MWITVPTRIDIYLDDNSRLSCPHLYNAEGTLVGFIPIGERVFASKNGRVDMRFINLDSISRFLINIKGVNCTTCMVCPNCLQF